MSAPLLSTLPASARALVRQTPLVFAPPLGAWLKLESLQLSGSFKLRGAAVSLARLAAQDRLAGVVTASAGNHGLGLAHAARALGLRAQVVVPEHAAEVKRAGIARLGAELIVRGSGFAEAEAAAQALAVERGAAYVSAFDDDDVIEGNGAWLAEELIAERPSLRTVVVPVGGGGLCGGMARALAPRGVRVLGVQPRANCAMYESLRLGRALTDYAGAPTLCGGLEGAVAERTYRLAAAHLGGIVLVEEEAVLRAMAFAYRALGLVVEPSSAVVLAAARAGRVPVAEDVVFVLTGSNVDAELLDRALALGAG